MQRTHSPSVPGGGGSPWPELGDLLAAHFDVPIGFTGTAVGSTKVEQWADANNVLNERLTKAMEVFGQGRARAVLWHQGESDASTPAQDYADDLNSLIAQSRTAAQTDIPWGVALVTNQAGQQIVINGDPLVFEGANTDTLGSEYRIGVHFNESGLNAHAALWFDPVTGWIAGTADPDVNADGVIDVADLGLVGGQWSTPGRLMLNADINFDGVIDIADLALVGGGWSTSAGPSSEGAASVPLPGGLSVASGVIVLVLCSGRGTWRAGGAPQDTSN